MFNDLFVYAIKDGQYISINSFKSGIGEKCGCICPTCGEPVCSNVTSKSEADLKKKFTNHFSHINKNSTCTGGYLETELHLFAKAVLKKHDSITVPGEKYHYPEIVRYTDVVLEKLFESQNFKQYRPDIIITELNGENIAIEIVVTNPVSESKRAIYTDAQFKCIIIDLSKYKKKNINDFKTDIEKEIINDAKIKKWLWPNLIQDIDNIDNREKQPKTTDSGCLVIFLLGLIVYLHRLLF